MRICFVAGVLLAGIALAACGESTSDSPISPATAPNVAPTATPADGRFSLAQLAGATLELPKVPGADHCAGGSVTLLANMTEQGQYVAAQPFVHADLDGDPALETAVAVRCSSGDPGPMWLVALDRDGTGKLVTQGVIVSTPDGQVKKVKDLAAASGGGVTLKVCVGCGSDPGDDRWISRTYRWTGTAFAAA